MITVISWNMPNGVGNYVDIDTHAAIRTVFYHLIIHFNFSWKNFGWRHWFKSRYSLSTPAMSAECGMHNLLVSQTPMSYLTLAKELKRSNIGILTSVCDAEYVLTIAVWCDRVIPHAHGECCHFRQIRGIQELGCRNFLLIDCQSYGLSTCEE